MDAKGPSLCIIDYWPHASYQSLNIYALSCKVSAIAEALPIYSYLSRVIKNAFWAMETERHPQAIYEQFLADEHDETAC